MRKNIHNNMRGVGLCAAYAHAISARPAGGEHGGVVSAKDKCVPLCVGQILCHSGRLVDIVAVRKDWSESSTSLRLQCGDLHSSMRRVSDGFVDEGTEEGGANPVVRHMVCCGECRGQ